MTISYWKCSCRVLTGQLTSCLCHLSEIQPNGNRRLARKGISVLYFKLFVILLTNNFVNGRNGPKVKNPQPDHTSDLNFSKFSSVPICSFDLDPDEINIHLIIIMKANWRSVCASNNKPFSRAVRAEKIANCYIQNSVICCILWCYVIHCLWISYQHSGVYKFSRFCDQVSIKYLLID